MIARTTKRLITLLICAVLVLAGCTGRFTRGDVELFIGASIPESASEIEFRSEREPSRIVWLKFRVTPQIAEQYAQNLGLLTQLRDNGRVDFNYTGDDDWWFDSDTDYQSARVTVNSKAYQLLLLPVNDNTTQVYLEVFAF